jgi:hypothetical protein
LHYGFGDIELGTKLRFVREGAWVPQIGTFPLLEVPTGSARWGLGNGAAEVLLPIWIQKSFGAWTTYGGGGLWLDAGDSRRHFWIFGWQVERTLFEGLAVGAEIYHQTVRDPGTERDTRLDVGAVIDLSEVHHLLFSAGRGLSGPSLFQGYLAYQVTVGPRE